MKIIRLTPHHDGAVDWPILSQDKRAVVTIGNFDGVHRGHQAVLSRAVELAHEYDVPSVAITFDPRPSVVHEYARNHNNEELKNPSDYKDLYALMNVDDRLAHIEKAGFDYAIVVTYTLTFAARTYIFFLGQLVGKLGMRTLVLGSDATMGKGREGNISAIRKLSAATGVFELEVVDDFGPAGIYLPREVHYEIPQQAGEPHNPLKTMTKAELRAWSKKHHSVQTREYSSSMVRFLLAHGCMHDATDILGHPHRIEAIVEHGQARGRELGFPTANCGSIQGFIPVDGVYAGRLIDHGDKGQHNSYVAAISIGTNDTFSGQDRTVEVYCLDAPDNLDLYDHHISVEFTDYLRPQEAFESVDELIDQMNHDVEVVRSLTK